jgi:hypothetical protein
MIKYALALLAITLTLANVATRFVPNEVRRISRVLSWLLAAYVAIMILLGIIANVSH